MNVMESYEIFIRWILLLGEFDFEITYKKGICNAQADKLSLSTTEGGKTIDVNEK